MTTQDITRHLLQPGKHYSGARMQQGRSVLDSDWNEDAMLEAEDLRATLAELTGAQGSTNAGFSISDVKAEYHPTSDGLTLENGLTYDFAIAPGSMFVGGLRVELEQSERFLGQADWLRLDESASNLPYRPLAQDLNQLPGKVRDDLVYLHVWEQTVSMVEDRELRERALGGSDTTTRVRRMRRVELLTGVGSNAVDQAFAVLLAQLESEGASFDHENAELASNARITVSAIVEGTPSACGPIVTGGYLGNEHQAIRVELRGSRAFTWGFCNAAPLHRVRLVSPSATASSTSTIFEFITVPHDEVARPRANQIVELLPWSAKLANEEKVAELHGPLFRVTLGYDPQTRKIAVDNPLPIGMAEWMSAKGGDEPHFYLRIWDRGADTTSPAEIPFVEAQNVPLGYTGLQVAFSPSGRIGDYWVIAARKGANARLLPWDLLDDAGPHGTRHFYAPLAILRWQIPESAPGSDFPPGVATIQDVRRRLQPLCQRGCTTVSVGDDVVSFGQVNSLAAAVALLPIAGGRISLLPGQHEVAVEIVGRSNIEIVGCGPRSVLVNAAIVTPTPAIGTAGSPLVSLIDCTDIVIKNLAIAADASVGIEIRNVDGQSERVHLEHLSFTATGTATIGVEYALPQAAVLALGCDDLSIVDCRVDVANVLNYTPAIVVGGNRLGLHRNWIQVGGLDTPNPGAMGGIHVLSQSNDVELIDNVIRNGWGNGITLGHLLAVDPPAMPPTVLITPAEIWGAAQRGVGDAITELLDWVPIAGAPQGALDVGEVWSPLGALTDVRIRGNDIRGMSLSGISSVFADTGDTPAMVVVVDADIQGNQLIENAQISNLGVAVFANFTLALGGVILAGSIRASIRENVIRDHGIGYLIPICGIGSLAAQNLAITDNRIVDNGTIAPAEEVIVAPGMRGGICVVEVCGVRGYTFADAAPYMAVRPPDVAYGGGELALRVHHNEVSQRTGKALYVRAGFGPIVVTENSLHSLGDPVRGMEIESSKLIFDPPGADNAVIRLAQGACVEILNYATSSEVAYGAGVLPTPVLVDINATPIADGRVSFCGNHTQLVWHWLGGYASSVLISTLDSVVANHNTMTVSMGNEVISSSGFIPVVLADPDAYSFLFVNCWLGASSSTQATGNRFEEGLEDVFLSHLAADAITAHGADVCVVKKALLATMNVGTHCVSGKPPGTHQKLFQHNIAISTEFGSLCAPAISFAAGLPQTITVIVP